MVAKALGLFVSLYTDEDVTADLAPALRRRGYTAQSTAEAGNLGISDEAQLTFATEQGMALLTYNAQHFIPLARAWYRGGRKHAGIVISEQMSQRRLLQAFPDLTPEALDAALIYYVEHPTEIESYIQEHVDAERNLKDAPNVLHASR